MAGRARAKLDPEREAILAAVKELAGNRPAAHGRWSFWTGMAVLACWLLLECGCRVVIALTPDERLAWALWEIMAYPELRPTLLLCRAGEFGLIKGILGLTLLLWVVSAVGLGMGILGLMQPQGKKTLAVGGIVLNGLLCVIPLLAVLLAGNANFAGGGSCRESGAPLPRFELRMG